MPFSSLDVRWAPDGPFSRAFSVSAHSQKLWIQGADSSGAPIDTPMHLMLKGANWAGFQSGGCVHELWKHDLQQYLDTLVDNNFNAVRLPLSLALVAADSWIIASGPDGTVDRDAEHPKCGREYEGLETLAILDDVLERLRALGIFVMLDMHTQSHPEGNQKCWENTCCSATTGYVCDEAKVERFVEAWRKLARRYCAQPNVIMADLFNEYAAVELTPYGPNSRFSPNLRHSRVCAPTPRSTGHTARTGARARPRVPTGGCSPSGWATRCSQSARAG